MDINLHLLLLLLSKFGLNLSNIWTETQLFPLCCFWKCEDLITLGIVLNYVSGIMMKALKIHRYCYNVGG